MQSAPRSRSTLAFMIAAIVNYVFIIAFLGNTVVVGAAASDSSTYRVRILQLSTNRYLTSSHACCREPNKYGTYELVLIFVMLFGCRKTNKYGTLLRNFT
jgi:hypothetical protein